MKEVKCSAYDNTIVNFYRIYPNIYGCFNWVAGSLYIVEFIVNEWTIKPYISGMHLWRTVNIFTQSKSLIQGKELNLSEKKLILHTDLNNILPKAAALANTKASQTKINNASSSFMVYIENRSEKVYIKEVKEMTYLLSNTVITSIESTRICSR